MAWRLPAFEELRELGSGGSGRVVLALHLPTGTEVAVKYLAEWLFDDPDLLAGFRSEAQLMAGLVDPHLVTLYEYVETPVGAAIVMDLLEGVSLRRMLDSDGPLTPEAALTLLKGSLLGLAALHRQGIAHRDYKPDNVIVGAVGGTTLIDYGIAAPVGEVAAASGTPRYMAPEQWRGEPSSAATDVYAATATFVECLTGRPVFPGETVPSLLHQHLHTPPRLDDVPEPVRPLAIAGLAKDSADRITDATALVAQLDALASAAYGEQWERRGREHLAIRAALLAFLFAHPVDEGVAQASVETDLGVSSPPGRGAGVAVRSSRPRAKTARAARKSARFASARRHRSTLCLGLLLLIAAVFAAMHVNAPAPASSAAFDTGAPTRGVVSLPPSAPPPAPTPSPSAPVAAPASASPTPRPSIRVTPRPSRVVTPAPIAPPVQPAPAPKPIVEPTTTPTQVPTQVPTSSPPTPPFTRGQSPPLPGKG
ncbi:MAG: eukaryotic-like serine/threonine-protein kinase [Frankiaceae bacterium]|nr:eukaryotic-like serine/threonine-protein kinase [Frankiaceae bacterium]